MKSNRLINDFRKQEKYSIWKHMEAMAVNYAVYSVHKMSVEPYLTGKDVYVYGNEENLVVVCLDCYHEKQKPVYEEGESMEPVILHPGQEPRDSMVWKLKETMRLMQRRLCLCQFDLNVYGILLTEARITNADDLEDMWFTFNIREDRLHSLQKGEKVRLTVPALDGREVMATVYYIAVRESYATWKATKEIGEYDTRTFEVRARPDSPVEGLLPGMSVILKRK